MRSAVVLALVVSLIAPSWALARQASADPPPPIDVDKLPISVERIRKRLATAPQSRQGGLRIEYYIQVYGVAPKIDLFAGVDLLNGPVPFGAPTHAEFLQLITPQEFRSPPADFMSLAAWIAQALARKAASKAAEREKQP